MKVSKAFEDEVLDRQLFSNAMGNKVLDLTSI